MLKPQIIHLKNVIVFKMVVVLLLGGFFFWMMPRTQDSLDDSKKRLELATYELNAISEKVTFVKNNSGTVAATYGEYAAALKNPFDVSCLEKEALIQQLDAIAAQFHLRTQPNMEIAPIPSMEKFNNNDNVQVMTSDLTIKFPAQGFMHALSFTKAAYNILPTYSLLASIDIEASTVITPLVLDELSTTKKPQLIDCKLDVEIREIKASNS